MVTMAMRLGFRGWSQKEKPVQKRKRERKGKVKRRRLRRPKVSIVRKAGRAKRKFRMPVPMEARRAEERV